MVTQNELAREIFGGLSASYDSVLDWMTLYQDRTWKRRMLQKLALSEGARMLDIGCGTCVLEERYQLRASQVVGVDITIGMVRLAQRKGLRSVSLGLADAEHLPFRDESFDLVLSCYVPKYCETRRFVEEAARVLKSGGRMAVYDFTRPHGLLAPLLNLYVDGFMPAFGKLVAPLDASLAFTCAALPGLIRSTTWDADIGDALAENDISKGGGREAMTGGVVTVFWAFQGLDSALWMVRWRFAFSGPRLRNSGRRCVSPERQVRSRSRAPPTEQDQPRTSVDLAPKEVKLIPADSKISPPRRRKRLRQATWTS